MIVNLIINTKTTSSIGISEIKFSDASGNTLAVTSPNVVTGTIVSGSASSAFDGDSTTLLVVTPDNNKVVKLSLDVPSEPLKLTVDLDELVGSYLMSNLSTITVTGFNSIVNNRVPYISIEGVYWINVNSDLTLPVSEPTSELAYYTTNVYTSGTYTDNGKTKYAFTDSSGTKFFNFFSNNSTRDYAPESPAIIAGNASFYGDTNIVNSSDKLKEQSSLANLYEQQAPNVVSITVSSSSATKTKINVLTDKNCQVVVYIINQDSLGNEQSFRYFARDSASSSKSHDYIVDKFTNKSRVIAIPINASFYKDFNAESEVSGVQTYNYSTFGEVLSRYQEGYDTGYKQAHQQLYPLGQPYGWNYDFNTRTDYGDSTVQSNFVQTIADNQYIGAYKEIYNRGNSYGFTYNSTSTSRTYYLGQQDSFISAISTTASVPVYKSFYDAGTAYGFNYNSASNDPTYLQNLRTSFISAVDSFSDKRAEKRSYSAIFQAAASYQNSKGLPEGFSAWSDVTTTDSAFTTRTSEFVRHLYNSGYAKASQVIYNSGADYGFNWRTAIGTLAVPSDTNLTAQYDGAVTAYVDTVTASAENEGIKGVYGYISTRFPKFTYNSTNSANLSNTAYNDYLVSIRQSAIDTVSNSSALSVYNTIFGRVNSDFIYTYNNSSEDPIYYRDLIPDMLGAVYNYGAIAAFQSVYDRGDNYYFKTVTNYSTVRDSRYVLKTIYNSAKTTQLEALKEDFEIRLYESGVVFTYKRFFDLALPYGFTYDNTKYLASYYDAKREEFLEIYSGGNLSEGIKYVLEATKLRYNTNYTFYADADLMKAQVVPTLDQIDLIQGLKAYTYTLDGGSAYGYTYTTPSTLNGAQALVNQLLAHIDNRSGLAAYNYVLGQANTRTSYTLPAATTSKITAQSYIIPMFKYVEDYKEADGYRRVHNYAKNFLNIGYTFQDSSDPRVLENQVPSLFDYLTSNGGTGAYKYIFEMAKQRTPEFNFTYYSGMPVDELKSQVPVMFDVVENEWGEDAYRYVYEFVNYPYLGNDRLSLKSEVGTMFDWLRLQARDIQSISDPIPLPNNRVKFVVMLKRPTTLIGVTTDKTSGKPMDFVNSTSSQYRHEITFKHSGNRNQKFDVMFIPGAQGTYSE